PAAASLAALTLAFSAASAGRRRAVPPEEAFSPRLPLEAFRGLGRNDKLALASAGVFLLLVGGSTAAFVCMPGAADRFTEFYILGPGGMAEGYPATVGTGEGQTITIGITNHEGASATYSILVRLGDSTIDTIGGIVLADGEGWAQPYTLGLDPALLPASGERARLDFVLTMNGGDQPYRSLHLWVSAAGAGS
ncbi:MAG TPA: DUF1616 domain-containing protein, partial [Candidatus Methanomethylicus sp.]|nr:DUF1616 domain-containing protein [Candidatus Methanomethylicus sp.]